MIVKSKVQTDKNYSQTTMKLRSNTHGCELINNRDIRRRVANHLFSRERLLDSKYHEFATIVRPGLMVNQRIKDDVNEAKTYDLNFYIDYRYFYSFTSFFFIEILFLTHNR